MAITEADIYSGLRNSRPVPASRTVEAVALLNVVEARIAELWRWRSWYRARPDWASFAGMRVRHDAELRALVSVARKARTLSAGGPDPITQAKGYHDWQAR